MIPIGQAQRRMAIWNGAITGVSYTAGPAFGENGGSPEGTNLTTQVTITFTATTAGSNVVIAWGGRVGSYIDWGAGDSASGSLARRTTCASCP